jgi:hypothetical protein
MSQKIIPVYMKLLNCENEWVLIRVDFFPDSRIR